MAKPDNGSKITNFEDVLSKAKNVSEVLNKKGSAYLELSRKRIEYMDAKSKLAKAYEKFGKLQYSAYIGEEVNEDEYAAAVADIAAYRERLDALASELDDAKMPKDADDLKKNAEELKNEMKSASTEAVDSFVRQARDFLKAVQLSVKSVTPSNVTGEVEVEYKEADVPMAERPEIDRWIISVLNTLVKDVDNCYNEYEPTKAGRLISDFVNDNLSNWYVRLNRKRFWGGGMTQDKLSAFQTLYTCLETVAKLMAPIAPFYVDMLYSDLTAATGRDNVVSVHLAKFPECKEEMIDKELEARMQMAQDVTSMVLALRRKVNIKVRQPLQCIMVPVVDEEQRAHIEAVKTLIMNEVNVKEIKFVDGAAGVLVKKVKCDFKKLGPKFGKQMKAVAAAVAAMPQEAIAELEKNGSYTLNLDGAEAVIETSDVEIFSEDIPGWLVANEGKLTVALEVTITEELRREGIARELVNRIQNIRKSSGFEITDKIKITLSKNPQTDDAVNEYKDYICNQVLGTSLKLIDNVEGGTELEFDDFRLYVSVVKE